jgi:hypothetical protein
MTQSGHSDRIASRCFAATKEINNAAAYSPHEEAMKLIKFCLLAVVLAAAFTGQNEAVAQTPAEIPPSITTPDKVESSIGTLEYKDGAPSKQTIEKAYDYLDLMRGVEAFVNAYQGASVAAIFKGVEAAGVPNNTALIFSELMDSKSLFLTANADTIYFWVNLDATKGPIVVETPPLSLGVVDDMWFQWITDFGLPGPDRGDGGKYLFVPPGYTGELPESGYFVQKMRTTRATMLGRAYLENNDPEAARRTDQEDAEDLSLSSRWIRHEHRLSVGGQGDVGAHA